MVNSFIDVSRRRIVTFVSIALVISLFVIAKNVAAASSPARSEQRMVTIYDQGTEQTIITKAQSVKEALDQAQIEVGGIDKVEPAVSTKLMAKNYRINIYRARPIILVDGSQRIKLVTAAQSPKQIFTAAGLELFDEDKTSFARSENVVDDGGAALRLNVDRATPVMFTLYGKQFVSRTQGETVGEMLKEKGVVLGVQDGSSASLDTPITPGMDLRVWRNGKQTLTQEEPITKPIEEIKDMDHEPGYREVRTPGKDGVKQVTYEIEMQNGQETSRKVIASVTTAEPAKEVVAVGAKARVISGTCSEWMAAAGVPNSASANYLIEKESHCNPNSVNRSSGACGIGQALPCSKMGPVNPDGTSAVDPVGQLRWMSSYVMGRYGSWDAAAAFHQRNGWY